MLMLTGLNHLTLAVVDLSRSVEFYRALPGFKLAARWEAGAYLSLGDLWLCLSLDERRVSAQQPDYTHYAFSVAQDGHGRLSSKRCDKVDNCNGPRGWLSVAVFWQGPELPCETQDGAPRGAVQGPHTAEMPTVIKFFAYIYWCLIVSVAAYDRRALPLHWRSGIM